MLKARGSFSVRVCSLLLCDVNYTSFCFLSDKKKISKGPYVASAPDGNLLRADVRRGRRGQRLCTYATRPSNELSQYSRPDNASFTDSPVHLNELL